MSATCFHCGEPLPAAPARAHLDGAERAFCCQGCATAASWIRDAGLTDYYRLRSSDGARVDPEARDFRAWDREDVLAEHSRAHPSGREITVLIEGMHCAACAWLIDRAVSRMDGVAEVRANAVTGRVVLAWDGARIALSSILERLASLGYRPHLAPDEALEQERRRARRQLIIRLGVAGLGTLQAMMFAEALYLDFDNQMPEATRDFLRWIAFLVATPVVFYAGWPFLAGMAREIRGRRLGMDTLVGGSVLLAYLASGVETVRGGPHVWIDAAVMFVFLLLAARAVEAFARQRANAAVDTLARARPALAWRLDDDGTASQVPLAALRVGDVVRVPAGEQVPADGELLDAGAFDEALLTGEARPVPRATGETVHAGSGAVGSTVRLRVARTGQDTRLSHLVRLVEEAQARRPRLALVAEGMASRFVSVLLVLAVGVFVLWWQIQPERAFEVTLALLVISCPCALSLALPAALGTAHGALARIGVLSLSTDALDALARADVVVFDKTGTLTEGRPRLHAVEPMPGITRAEACRLAAALEAHSNHPLAQAFRGLDAAQAASVQAVPGEGVEGEVEGRRLRLGRARFAAAREDDDAIWLGDGTRALARFLLADRLREDAAEAVDALKALGLSPRILSGDAPAAVGQAARSLGVAAFGARLTPEDKLARVRALQAEGHVVAMVGDGINDAPVLAGADVSIALAAGAALAHRSADLVVTGERLARLPQAVALARRTRRVVRQNLAWALAYNVLAIPVAAMGWVTPWLAALGMAGSSLLVTLNALRLARVGGRLPPSPAPARLGARVERA